MPAFPATHDRARSARVAFASAAALVVASCIPDVNDDLSTVSKARLLAIRAFQENCGADPCPAEVPLNVASPPKMTLEALVAVPNGAQTPEVRWTLCTDPKPLTELGPVNPACLSPNAGASVSKPISGGGSLATNVDVPSDACQFFGPNAPPPMGRPTDPDPTGGYYQPIVAFVSGSPELGTIRINCGGGIAVSAPEYNARYRLNENPAIDSLSIVAGVAKTEIAPLPGGGTNSPADSGNDAGDVSSDAAQPSNADGDATTDAAPPSNAKGDAGPTARAIVRAGSHVSLRATWTQCPRASVCGDGVCGEHEDISGLPDAGPGQEHKCLADCASLKGKPIPRGCSGAETYAWADPNARAIFDRRESIVVSWYASDGQYDNRRTGVAESDPDEPSTDNGWVAPTAQKIVRLWLVIRDDRGGVGWQSYEVSVQ